MKRTAVALALSTGLLGLVFAWPTGGCSGRQGPSRSTASRSNLRQLGMACAVYANLATNLGHYPDDPALLYPEFIPDRRLLQNPRYPERSCGYFYIPGNSDTHGEALLAYEASLEDPGGAGGNILTADGAVRWVEPAEFRVLLQRQALAAGAGFKKVPILWESFPASANGHGH